VVLLGDALADWFLDLKPPPPPNGSVVVAGGEEGEVIALVLGRDLDDARGQLDRIAIVDEVEGCVRGGITCCDLTTKTYVIDGEFEGKRVWLPLGERCEGLAPRIGFDYGPPFGEEHASVVELGPAIMSALAEYGVTYPFMTLAEESGHGRILADASYDVADLRLPTLKNRPGAEESLAIILAGHKVSSRPECVSSVAWCRKDNGDRCNNARRHWFRWNDVKESWCQMGDKCKC
jgi:hypothetical protein